MFSFDGGVEGVIIRSTLAAVVNAGTITGTAGDGIYVNGGGSVTNRIGGTISGSAEGVNIGEGVDGGEGAKAGLGLDTAVFQRIGRAVGLELGPQGVGIADAAEHHRLEQRR